MPDPAVGEDVVRRAFERQIEPCETSGSPLYAATCRALAVSDDLLADAVQGHDVGHHPIRVLAALHYLALADGIDPWADPAATIAEHRDWIAGFVSTQRVQTNEVQRSWCLVPAFLSLGAPRLDLLELGSSAGLNLVWDRYLHRYAAGARGPDSAPLALGGEERAPVPAALLTRSVEVVRRRGVDLDPVDAASEDGARLLRCFTWADQQQRLDRLDRALVALRADPPELIRGDYVTLLPELLEDRVDDALLVVFQTASTQYLRAERYAELKETLARARKPLAWISTRSEREEETSFTGGFELEVALWPDRHPSLVARMGYHGQWLEWRGWGQGA